MAILFLIIFVIIFLLLICKLYKRLNDEGKTALLTALSIISGFLLFISLMFTFGVYV